mmetsp:Transcript_81672/g.189691  ORF Transcript_81672/g.189691 Transcript_81672/m.189691 type:complete len:81 (+) Transcript_81672:66-308(+)
MPRDAGVESEIMILHVTGLTQPGSIVSGFRLQSLETRKDVWRRSGKLQLCRNTVSSSDVGHDGTATAREFASHCIGKSKA